MTRKLYVSIVLVLSLGLLATSLSLAQEKLTFGNTVRENPLYNLPVLAGQHFGFFKEQGLEVKWAPFKGGSAMHRALAAGAVQVAITTAPSIIRSVSRGLPEIIVADLKSGQGFYFWVRSDSRLKKPKDLKGARIGVTRLGGTAHAYAQLLIRAVGLEKNVTYVGAGGIKEAVGGLRAGTLDAIVQSDFSTAPVKAKGYVRELLNIWDYTPKEWLQLVLIAHTDMPKQKPKSVKGVVTAIFKAGQAIIKEKEWTLATMESTFGYSKNLARTMYPKLRYGSEGKINVAGLRNVRQFLIDFKLVKKGKVPPLKSLYTNRFVQ